MPLTAYVYRRHGSSMNMPFVLVATENSGSVAIKGQIVSSSSLWVSVNERIRLATEEVRLAKIVAVITF